MRTGPPRLVLAIGLLLLPVLLGARSADAPPAVEQLLVAPPGWSAVGPRAADPAHQRDFVADISSEDVADALVGNHVAALSTSSEPGSTVVMRLLRFTSADAAGQAWLGLGRRHELADAGAGWLTVDGVPEALGAATQTPADDVLPASTVVEYGRLLGADVVLFSGVTVDGDDRPALALAAHATAVPAPVQDLPPLPAGASSSSRTTKLVLFVLAMLGLAAAATVLVRPRRH